MATTVKIMLNDRESILELAKDPEVQAKIKAALVDEVAKRAAKAVQAALEKSIETAVSNAMYDFLRATPPNDVVKRVDLCGNVQLSDKLKKKIRDTVNDHLTLAAFDYVEKFPENEQLREALQHQVEYAKTLDVKKMLYQAVEKLARDKFGGT